MANRKPISADEQKLLLTTLKCRFEKNMYCHSDMHWDHVQAKLEDQADKLWSLNAMENTGGEPDVVGYDKSTEEFIFQDCSVESPSGRRSLCYDREGLESRKEHKPKDSAMDMATAMGVTLLNEEEYRVLQKLRPVDTKTSSWLHTPKSIREKGGALFGDYRYGAVFVYHNGAQSYYGSRGFRGTLRV